MAPQWSSLLDRMRERHRVAAVELEEALVSIRFEHDPVPLARLTTQWADFSLNDFILSAMLDAIVGWN